MFKFRAPNVVPPGNRYFYEVPETKVFLESPTASTLIRMIEDHYRASWKTIPGDLRAAVENFMCARLPPGFCVGEEGDKPLTTVFHLSQVRRRTQLLVAGQIAKGLLMPAEARKRADVCTRCPSNDRSVCPSCVGLNGWACRQIGVTNCMMSEWLGVCRHDGLALAAGVHLKDAPLPGDIDVTEVPDKCWRTKNA